MVQCKPTPDIDEFGEAENILDQLLIDGEIADMARFNFAGKMMHAGDYTRGLRVLAPCLESPRLTEVHILAAKLLVSVNRFNEAVTEAMKGLQENFQNSDALNTYAFCYREKIRANAVLTPEEDQWYESALTALRKLPNA